VSLCYHCVVYVIGRWTSIQSVVVPYEVDLPDGGASGDTREPVRVFPSLVPSWRFSGMSRG